MTDTPGGASERGGGSGDPFDIVLDEDFVKGATAKEPTARTRELSAKWAKEPPKAVAWRADGPDPLGGRGGGAFGTPGRGANAGYPVAQRRKRRWPGLVAVLVGLALILTYFAYPRHETPSPPNAEPAGTAQPWADGPSPSPSPSPSQSFADPDDQYFVGSPALNWADNEAGLTAPKAKAVGRYSASTVAAAYKGLIKLLAAGNLDATVLDGGSTADFTKLVDPGEPLAKSLKQWIEHPSYQDDPTAVVTRFNPKRTLLLGGTVKVDGTMSAAVNKQGDLLVTGDYRFVYAVGSAVGSVDATRAIVHRVYVLQIGRPGEYSTTAGTYWLSDYASQLSNDSCGVYDGYINPQFAYSNADSSQQAAPGKTVDPYASENLLASTAPAAGSGSGSSPSPGASPTECDADSQI